jgi:ribosome biogenesis protein ENP2
MAAHVSVVNGVSIYSLSSSKAQPAWLSAAKKRALKKNVDYTRRVELLQDFTFPEASQTIAVSPDGRYVVGTGTYPPRVRVWDTAELSMKFERYMDATPVATCVLASDYSKLAFLQDDRNVELHAAYGRHYRTRIPTAGRCMAWHAPTAELLMGCSGRDVFRLSLEEGRFLEPLELHAESTAANGVAVSRTTALVAVACDGGAVEIFDPRSRARAGRVRLSADERGAGVDATAVGFEEGGLGLVAGASDGRCLVFDLRAAAPVTEKAHPYGLPVLSAGFHRSPARLIMSADAKQVKFWGRDDGAAFTNVEVGGDGALAAVVAAGDAPGAIGAADSGLLFLAGDADRVGVKYVPALGPAPKWASFVDALTEEVDGYVGGDEGTGVGGGGGGGGGGAPGAVFDDYKFLTREELTALGLNGLVGTPLLRAYLHGFFIDARLHRRVASHAPAAAADAFRAERVRAAVDATRASRVEAAVAAPAVNAALAARLRADADGGGAGSSKAAAKKARRRGSGRTDEEVAEEAVDMAARRGAGAGEGASDPAPASILDDARFKSLFSDPAFAIDATEAELLANARGMSAPGGSGAAKGAGGGKPRGHAGGGGRGGGGGGRGGGRGRGGRGRGGRGRPR